jgi:uncharacterized LabA/DUF88 family protein
MIADDLRRPAYKFIELDDLRDVIGRPPRDNSDEGAARTRAMASED